MTLPRIRISIATIMMLVITAAAASALVARVVQPLQKVLSSVPLGRYNLAAVLILGIVLTGVALAARKGHSPNQAMLQIALACLGFLFAVSLPDFLPPRARIYWLQVLFAVLVVIPLVVRRTLKNRTERGPQRAWRMKTCEAVAFAYFNMILVLVGIAIEGVVTAIFM